MLSESQKQYAWQFAGRPDEKLNIEWDQGLQRLDPALKIQLLRLNVHRGQYMKAVTIYYLLVK